MLVGCAARIRTAAREHLRGQRVRARRMGFTVAIDGPAAAGKGTIARAVAAHFGFAHLDTGLLYRATGRRVLDGADALVAAKKPRSRGLGPSRSAQPRGCTSGITCRVPARGPSGIAEFPAELCPAPRWGCLGRARYRHGDLPQCGGKAVCEPRQTTCALRAVSKNLGPRRQVSP